MIDQDLIRAGGAYVGKNGEIRHVYCVSRPGNGYCVQWDSIPRPSGVGASLSWFETRKDRAHGIMQMRRFQKWAVAVC